MSFKRSTFKFAMGTILSRISGLARDSVLAAVFGASASLDAFIVAFRIPNLFRDMLAEGALSGAFTKVYSATQVQSPEAGLALFRNAARAALVLSTVFCALGVIFAPQFVDLMTFMGEDFREHRDEVVFLTRILFPFLILPIVGSILTGVLHYHGRFFVSAISSIVQNLGYIIGALWIAKLLDQSPIIGLCIGVMGGGIAQLIWQWYGIPKEFRAGLLSSLRWVASPDLRKVVVLMMPATIAASAGPINNIVNTNFATSVGPGAVSWLNYAFRLLQLPIGVFGVAIASTILPQLTKTIAKSGHRVNAQASKELQDALELALWLIVPSFIFIHGSASPLIKLMFQHAAFTADDAEATALALEAYSFGIVGYGLIKVMTAFYFAVDRSSYAMRVSLASIGVNLVGNAILVRRYGHFGLAITSSVSLSLNAVILFLGMQSSNVTWEGKRGRLLLAYLAGVSFVSGVAQILCTKAFRGLNWGSVAGLKAGALLECTLNGLVVAICFILVAAHYYKLKPTEIVERLLKRKKPQAQ